MSNRIRLKFIYLVAITAMLGLSTGRMASANLETKTAQPPPGALGESAAKRPERAEMDDSLRRAVEAARYQVEERAGGYRAANPAQKYLAGFTADGIQLKAAGRSGGDWRLGMRLSGYGYGKRKIEVGPGSLTASNNRITYERQAKAGGGSEITEWYVNRPDGIEQGFTIPKAPGEKAAGERLTLWLELSGDLEAKLDGAGEAITLSGGGAELKYDQLYAYDARGRALGARMSLTGGEIRLEVEDETAVYPVTVDPHFTQQAKLVAGDAAADDQFGLKVAISGDTAVVSAQLDDNAATDSGSVYVFVRSGTTWSQQQKLTPSDTSGGRFGTSVAIDGNTIVVGADLNNTAGIAAGAAFVFVRSGATWSEQQKLSPSDAAAFDFFGASVAIAGDTIVVGAPSDSTAGADAGSAYVFVRSGTTWSQQIELFIGVPGQSFGNSVAISGERVVVGARLDDGAGTDSGSAFVFVRSGTSWSGEAVLVAGDAAAGDNFGFSVAISGDTAVVGAPFDGDAGMDSGSAYVFVRSGTSWSQQQKLTASDGAAGDFFGFSVAIDGDTAVAGARFNDGAGTDAGAAYVFERSGTTWSQHQKLTAGDAAAEDRFGSSVAIAGNTVVVGSPFDSDAGVHSGSAYVFAASAPGAPGYASMPAPGSTINVGSATVGSSTSANLTVSETGNATLQVTSHSLSGPNAADFSVSPATLTIPDGGAPQNLTITCTPGAVGPRTATLTVNHNAPGSPATYPLTCTGLAAGDPFADAVAASFLVGNPNNAVGAPDGRSASLIGLLNIPSLTLDMGAGEEGTGDLKVHYTGLSAQLVTSVDFLRADGSRISSGQLQLIDLSAGTHIAVARYTGAEPYRFVRLRGLLFLSFGVDAVEAITIVGQ